jgi:hypothetical protein
MANAALEPFIRTCRHTLWCLHILLRAYLIIPSETPTIQLWTVKNVKNELIWMKKEVVMGSFEVLPTDQNSAVNTVTRLLAG